MGTNGKSAPFSREENISSRMNKKCRVQKLLVRCQQIWGAELIFCACKWSLKHVKAWSEANLHKILQ